MKWRQTGSETRLASGSINRGAAEQLRFPPICWRILKGGAKASPLSGAFPSAFLAAEKSGLGPLAETFSLIIHLFPSFAISSEL